MQQYCCVYMCVCFSGKYSRNKKVFDFFNMSEHFSKQK